MAESKAVEPGELSEGEIADSSDSSPDSTLPDSSPATKKRKISPKEEQEDDEGDGWITVGPSKGKARRRLKKHRKNKIAAEKKKRKSVDYAHYASSSTWLRNEFTSTQNTIAEALSKLSQGEKTVAKLPTLKTALLQNLLFYLAVNQRANEIGSSNDSGLKYLVIWLSNVSEKFFSSSEKHFPKLKLFNPSVQFKIEHPGSSRYARLGLESFMVIAGSNGDSQATSPPTDSTDAAPPNRTAYLFTKEQLRDHGFPNLSLPIDQLGRDCSNFCRVVDWPEGTIKAAATEDMPMFAIDCEMVEVRHCESELARISIVNESLECIYDTFVKPKDPITDYRTKYSGIDENTLTDVTTTLDDVQEKLRTLLPSNAILIGHSLENDFLALKFVHPFVIDTSCIFTPTSTPLNKPSLRRLTKELLTSDIQSQSNGHCSIEDATACMRLVQLKLREGRACQASLSMPSSNLFRELQSSGCKTAMIDKAGVVRLFGKTASFSREVDSDDDVVTQTKDIIQDCHFTFVQLHGMENFRKSSEKNDAEKMLQVVNDIDSNVVKLVENCPNKTMVFVVCGSSEISQVKYYQQQDIVDFRKLKEAVMVARTGMVVAFMVN